MLKRIETENGKRWAVVFEHDDFELQEIAKMRQGLVNMLIIATQSNLYGSSPVEFFETLKWLHESFLSAGQYAELEELMREREG